LFEDEVYTLDEVDDYIDFYANFLLDEEIEKIRKGYVTNQQNIKLAIIDSIDRHNMIDTIRTLIEPKMMSEVFEEIDGSDGEALYKVKG
jgi:hypothetical protein